ncbi:YciI family protein [Nocardioides cheoyonin]|uniref:YciI family protein n=1 Tax=Nocardioides cheoyonin TaxID=3156615 RepID=UPI0032B42C4E
MATVAVLYDYNDDTETKDKVRPEHRAFLASLPNLLLSGPMDNGGALLVLEGEVAGVEEQLDADPFMLAGVIVDRTVATWDVVLGSKRDLVAP